MTLPLPPRDPRIHVFSLSHGALELPHQTYLSQLSEAVGGTSLAEAFGARVDATYAEVFAVSDVAPLGLRAYLAQAHDIPEATLGADAARLDSLSGDVVVLAARAVEGVGVLEPRPELTHIGSYAPAEADMAATGVPRVTHVPPLPSGAADSDGRRVSRQAIAWIVAAALLLAALLFFLL